MQEPYLGDVRMFGGNFAPRTWAFCDGRLLSISQNSALYSLLGTTYGGDGITTFALPDLRGRVPVGQGQAPGLSNYVMGQRAGTEQVTLLMSNLPSHNHGLFATQQDANTSTVGSTVLTGTAKAAQGTPHLYTAPIFPRFQKLIDGESLFVNSGDDLSNSLCAGCTWGN